MTELEQLIVAVIDNNINRIKILLQKGVDPNGYLDEAKLRPLHFAAQNNSFEAAKLLITAGADINACTDDQERVIDIAKLHKHDKFVDFLLRFIK